MDHIRLNNGTDMPVIGYGTYKTPSGSVCVEGVRHAIETGYRMVDTAFLYGNEESVREGILSSGVDPDGIFLTTKLWNDSHGYDAALRAFDRSAENLRGLKIDLYLVHWPAPLAHREDWKTVLPDTWRAMERIYRDGRVGAIGVCNCLPHHLRAILDSCEVLPAVNQIEFHVGCTQDEAVQFSMKRGIVVQAWAPLSRARAFGLPEVRRVSEETGRTPAQVLLRYCMQKGTVPLPKSVTPSRIDENFDVFGFSLTESQIGLLDGITAVGRLGYHPDDCKS